jgi:hypothetical protein
MDASNTTGGKLDAGEHCADRIKRQGCTGNDTVDHEVEHAASSKRGGTIGRDIRNCSVDRVRESD